MSMRTEFEKENCKECPILFSGKYGCVPREGKYYYKCLLGYLETHTIPRSEALERDKVRGMIKEQIEKAHNVELPNRTERGYWTALTTKETRTRVLKDLLDMVGEKQ